MTGTLSGEEYKFKKGDSLDVLAKKHGLKDGAAIWKAPQNKAIAAKRHTPDHLQAGDVLFIPPSAAEAKAAQAADAKHLAAVDVEIKRAQGQLATYDKVIAITGKITDETVRQLQAQKDKMVNAGSAADAAAMVASVAATLGGLCKTGAKAATATGKELEELNKEMLKGAASMPRDGVMAGTAKALQTLSESSNDGVLFVRSMGVAYDKATSPSFWANAFSMLSQGKSWSEAAAAEVGAEVDELIERAKSNGEGQVHSLQALRKRVATHIAALQNERKQLEARMRSGH